jgi:hypothetical protein
MGISPLLSAGKLVSDSAHKAKLLVNQFSSVFTKDDGNDGIVDSVSFINVDLKVSHMSCMDNPFSYIVFMVADNSIHFLF